MTSLEAFSGAIHLHPRLSRQLAKAATVPGAIAVLNQQGYGMGEEGIRTMAAKHIATRALTDSELEAVHWTAWDAFAATRGNCTDSGCCDTRACTDCCTSS